MAKITKTKYTVEVEHAGPTKNFEDLFLKPSKRLTNWKAEVVETKTETVRKPKQVTQQMHDTQTVKRIFHECLKSLGFEYIKPNSWYDDHGDRNLYSLRANNANYGSPGIDIYLKTRSETIRTRSRRYERYVHISPQGVLEFKTYAYDNKSYTKVVLADPDSIEQIKKILKNTIC